MKTAEEGKYLFVKNINNKYIDGILDNETMLLLCACTEENADIIIKALNYNQKMEEIMPELFDWIIIFVQKARVVDDPRLDRLFELDDLYQKVYSDNRIRHDFFIAAQMAYMAVFNEIFKSFLKQEEK